MSRFWELMEDEFGSGYAKSLARDVTLAALGGRTGAQALEDGVDPRQVWDAICVIQEVPEARRFGKIKPPKR